MHLYQLSNHINDRICCSVLLNQKQTLPPVRSIKLLSGNYDIAHDTPLCINWTHPSWNLSARTWVAITKIVMNIISHWVAHQSQVSRTRSLPPAALAALHHQHPEGREGGHSGTVFVTQRNVHITACSVVIAESLL